MDETFYVECIDMWSNMQCVVLHIDGWYIQARKSFHQELKDRKAFYSTANLVGVDLAMVHFLLHV